MSARGRPESTRSKFESGRQWGYAVWIADVLQGLLYLHFFTDRERVARILGLGSPTWWKILLLSAALLFSHGITMSASSLTLHRLTRLVYAEDRKSFALAGGFDVGHWPILASQAGLYGLYRWTLLRPGPDPITGLRHWWIYLLVSLGLGIVLTIIAGNVVYRRYRRVHSLTLRESLRGAFRTG